MYFPVTILVLACTSTVEVAAFVARPSATTPSAPSVPSSSTCLHYRNDGGDYDYSQGNLKYGTSKYTARNGYDGFNSDASNMGPMGRSMQYNVQRDSDRVRDFERLRHYGQFDDEFSPEFVGRMDERMMYGGGDFEGGRFDGGRGGERDFGFRGDDYFDDYNMPGQRGGGGGGPPGGYRESDRDSDPILGRNTRSGRDGRGFNPTDPINRRSPHHLFGRRQEGRDYYGRDESPPGGGREYDPRELRSRFGSRGGPHEGGGNGPLLRDHFRNN